MSNHTRFINDSKAIIGRFIANGRSSSSSTMNIIEQLKTVSQYYSYRDSDVISFGFDIDDLRTPEAWDLICHIVDSSDDQFNALSSLTIRLKRDNCYDYLYKNSSVGFYFASLNLFKYAASVYLKHDYLSIVSRFELVDFCLKFNIIELCCGLLFDLIQIAENADDETCSEFLEIVANYIGTLNTANSMKHKQLVEYTSELLKLVKSVD